MSAPPAPRRRWRDLPWATQLAFLLVLLAVAPLTVMTLYNHAAARRDLVAATRAQAVQRARATAAALDSELARALADVSFLAVDGATVRFLAGDRHLSPARGEVRTTLRQLRGIHQFDALYLTDRAGRVVAASDDRLLGRSYFAAPEYLTAIAGMPAVHEPRWDPLDRRVFLHVSAPVRQPDGGLVGTAVGRFGLRRLDRLIATDSNFAGRNGYGVLWDAHGIRLSHPTTPALTFRPFAPLQPELVERLAAEEQFGPATRRLLTAASGARELVELSGWLLYDRSRPAHAWLDREAAGAGPPGPVLAAVAPLHGERWLYGIFTPEASILASLRRETGRALLFAGGTAIGAVLLALWTAGRMAEPLRRMGRVANALARGDMTRRVRLDRGDELGETAAAFDAMADALAATEAELRAHAGELERRVEERTAALAASEAELRATVGREQEARRRAEEANRLKDEFLSTVSHELRTPLNAILGWAYVLQTGSLDDEAAPRALASIERNARAQSQIIDDLLDVSRIITGKLRSEARAGRPRAGGRRGIGVGAPGGRRQGDRPAAGAGGPGREDRRRRRTPAAGGLEPARQRRQVHARGGPGRGGGGERSGRSHAGGARQRLRHPPRLPPLRLRPLPPGRQHGDARPRRPRARAGDRPPPRGAPRRHRRGRQRRRGPRRDLQGHPAAPRRRAARRRRGRRWTRRRRRGLRRERCRRSPGCACWSSTTSPTPASSCRRCSSRTGRG